MDAKGDGYGESKHGMKKGKENYLVKNKCGAIGERGHDTNYIMSRVKYQGTFQSLCIDSQDTMMSKGLKKRVEVSNLLNAGSEA